MCAIEHKNKLIDAEAMGEWMVTCKPVARIATIADLEAIYYSEINTDELIYEVEGELEFMSRTLDELRATYPQPEAPSMSLQQAGLVGLAWDRMMMILFGWFSKKCPCCGSENVASSTQADGQKEWACFDCGYTWQ